MNISQAGLSASLHSKRGRGEASGSYMDTHSSKRQAAIENPPSPRQLRSRKDGHDQQKVQNELPRREKEREREKRKRVESKKASPIKERGCSRSPLARKAISFGSSPPRPKDQPDSSLMLESAVEGQLTHFRRILGKEVAEDDLSSHFARASFLVEKVVLEAAMKASSSHSEPIHYLSHASAQMKQSHYELGAKKAKVAEMEDKLEGVEETCPLLEKARFEVYLLQHEVARLRDEVKAAEASSEKEVEALREHLRWMKGQV